MRKAYRHLQKREFLPALLPDTSFVAIPASVSTKIRCRSALLTVQNCESTLHDFSYLTAFYNLLQCLRVLVSVLAISRLEFLTDRSFEVCQTRPLFIWKLGQRWTRWNHGWWNNPQCRLTAMNDKLTGKFTQTLIRMIIIQQSQVPRPIEPILFEKLSFIEAKFGDHSW